MRRRRGGGNEMRIRRRSLIPSPPPPPLATAASKSPLPANAFSSAESCVGSEAEKMGKGRQRKAEKRRAIEEKVVQKVTEEARR